MMLNIQGGCMRFKVVKCYYVTDHIVLEERQIFYVLLWAQFKLAALENLLVVWRPSARLPFGSFYSWFHWREKIINVSFSLLCSCLSSFFHVLFSWTQWDKGKTVTQWSEQMDPDLHGRSSWLCDCFSALCLILCLSVCLSSLYLNAHTHKHSLI